jgi:hypothetical protein
MSLQRRIDWSASLRTLCADRRRLAPGVLTAKSYTASIARIRGLALVTAAGTFDRRVIMAVAVAAAKAQQARTGEAWAVCMSAALKGAWIAARAARLAAAH